MIKGLYAITPDMPDTEALLVKVGLALEGGAAVVQYRSKNADVALRHEQASELAALCRDFHVPLIINDDLRLADLVNADGVHLGKDDGTTVKEARMILGPDRIIGISCYADFARALLADREGADYVAFGSFFPSPTKPDAVPASPGLLRQAKTRLHLPVVAIGGITLDNSGTLIDAGADAVAVISALFDSPDIRITAAAFAAKFATRH
jgi:thiamine-phosphate pyrophosphorylase